MSSLKQFLTMACVSGALLAQAPGDLNALTSAAAHFVSSGMTASHYPEHLDLGKIVGDNGNLASGTLMATAEDVQHWTFLYRLERSLPTPPDNPDAQPPAPGTEPPAAGADSASETLLKTYRSVSAQCTRGVFSHFQLSASPVLNVKSLQFTWFAVNLKGAIASLNTYGYARGFQSVTLLRPDHAGLPDDPVYLFDCPWERQMVAISCQSGMLSWTVSY